MSADGSIHFATHHPADGRALRYHFDEFMLSWVRDLVSSLAQRPLWGVASKHLGSDAVALYMEQALGLDLHLVARRVFQAQFAASQGGAVSAVPVLSTLAELLQKRASQIGIPLVPSAALDWQRRYFQLRRAVRQTIVGRWPAASQKTQAKGFNVAVELVEGADPGKKCDAFWLASGMIDPARVLFVLEGANRMLVKVEENVDAIRRIGARAVAVDPVMARANAPFWKPDSLPAWVGELSDQLPQPVQDADRWLAAAIRSMAQRVGYWQAFFGEHGVQAIQQFTEFSLETVAKRIAIDRLGGIELGKQRSQFFERASAAFYFRYEIAFLWHRNDVRFLRSGYTRTDYAVETGYVYDYLIRGLKAEGEALRNQLTSKGASTIICMFDSHSHPHTHFSTEHLEAFYEAVLQLAEGRPSVGLIVKSKKPGIIPGSSGIVFRLRSLMQAGRCIVVDQPLVSVLPAALASDLALAIPASTAACEAALVGCSVLMYDPSRSGEHPWAKEGDIMFSDLEAFRGACVRKLEMLSSGQRGMPRARLLELDPFLDGSASQRAARFINAFLGARESGLDKPASLSAALEGCAGYAVPVDARVVAR